MARKNLAPIAMFVMAFAVMAGVFGSTTAQGTDAPPAAGTVGTPHPAHMYSGTCDTLGDVVFPLNDVHAANMGARIDATPVTGSASTPVARNPVIESTTTVNASLGEILAEEHAINVHQSEENIDVSIACGDITGEPEAGLLDVELRELNGSGYMGEATLAANDDGTTNVTVTLVYVGEATPVATPAS